MVMKSGHVRRERTKEIVVKGRSGFTDRSENRENLLQGDAVFMVKKHFPQLIIYIY